MTEAGAPYTLDQLTAGQQSAIVAMPTSGQAFLRLREMGVLPGTVIKLVRRAPMGDPIEILVRGYRLSLRKTEAAQITVKVS